MKPFIEYENNNLPFSYISYAFKCRLILLASVNDAAKINIAFRDPIAQRHRQHESHDGVYITDDQYVLQFASKHVCSRFLRQFSIWLYFLWRWLQYDLDGPYTISPMWQSVLHVDEIANKDDIICVNETLVLFLTSEESYDLIIPKITGPYSRLVLHGYNYTWPQVKRLIHKRVKQVRIMDCIEVDPEEYDDVVEFILRFSRSYENKFALLVGSFPLELMAKLNKAFKHHGTHTKITPYLNNNGLTYFNHKHYWCLYYIICVVCCGITVIFMDLFFLSLYTEELTPVFLVSLFLITIFLQLLLPFFQLLFMAVSLFKIKPADVVVMNAVINNNG